VPGPKLGQRSVGLWDLRGAPEVHSNRETLDCFGKASSQVTPAWQRHGLWSELRKHEQLGKYFFIKKEKEN